MSTTPLAVPETPYQDLILNHAKTPRRYGKTPGAASHAGVNPLCGDEIDLYLTRSGDVLSLSFESRGCALCRASASVLADSLSDQSQAAARALSAAFATAFRGDGRLAILPRSETRGGLEALLAMRPFATRARCVLLPWETFNTLLEELP